MRSVLGRELDVGRFLGQRMENLVELLIVAAGQCAHTISYARDVPICPQCGKQWPEGYVACPDDGTRIAARPGTSNENLPAGSAVGEYVIEQKLGEGGMGAVYGARHPVIGKRAAVKVLKRERSASVEGVARFVREAQAVNTIGHPNIVDVFGFGALPDGRSFFVMEWLEGESLRDRLVRPLPLGESLEVLESIAIALQAAHEAGVIHRDLKPDNVFLARVKGAPTPRVKLLDFGLAKLQGESRDARIDQTRSGVVMGTPLYLSPEQAKGSTKLDAATDVYSLGAMAYELGSGTVPFTADSAVEIMAKHISEPPPSLHERAPNLPAGFVQLVEQMLEKDPRARPAIADVVTRLAAMRADPDNAHVIVNPRAAAAIASTVVSADVRPRRRGGLVIAVSAAVAIAAGGTAFVVHGQSSSRPAAIADAAIVKAEAPDAAPIAETKPVEPRPVEPRPIETKPIETHHAARLGTVAITISAHGTVFVDGKLVASDVAETSLELTAGPHRLRVEAPGRQPVQQTIRVEAGARKSIAIELRATSINEVHDPFSE
jgi:eukaryotic-like serine/threonine-protein kinase